MTRGRLLFAVGFAVAVSTVIVLRDQGYLLGRKQGGPLRMRFAGDASSGGPRNSIAGFGLFGNLSGDRVEVQNFAARVLSPGVELLGPRVALNACGVCDPRRWPPPGAGAVLEGERIGARRPEAIIGLRARRPGLYYLLGFYLDYRRGQRRFRDTSDQSLCIAVATSQKCNLSYGGPGSARVAQIGGPSSYPGAKLTKHAASYGPGTHALRITLVNRTHSPIVVSGLPLGARPARLRLRARGHRSVVLQMRCPAGRVRRLRARVDGRAREIPLSLPLACA